MANESLYDTLKGREKVLSRFSVLDGTGIDLRGCESLDCALDTARINYGGVLSPIFLENGAQIPNNFCVTHSIEGTPLGVVGNQYTPIHNHDAFSVAGELVENFGFKFETGGASRGSRMTLDESKAFLVLRGEDVDINGDIFNTFAVFRNSFDGSGGVQYRFLVQRLVCLNGMTRYLGGKKSQLWINIQHSQSASDRLQVANTTIKNFADEIDHIRKEAQLFASTKFSRSEFEHIVIPTLLSAMKLDTTDERQKTVDKVTTVVQKALSAYDAEDTAMYNGTAYKAILAMTDFESHFEPLRNTQNPSIYMNRVLGGMALTTAVANIILQTKGIRHI